MFPPPPKKNSWPSVHIHPYSPIRNLMANKNPANPSWWFQPIWKILISQNRNLLQIGVQIKNLWNHHQEPVEVGSWNPMIYPRLSTIHPFPVVGFSLGIFWQRHPSISPSPSILGCPKRWVAHNSCMCFVVEGILMLLRVFLQRKLQANCLIHIWLHVEWC